MIYYYPIIKDDELKMMYGPGSEALDLETALSMLHEDLEALAWEEGKEVFITAQEDIERRIEALWADS